MTHDNERLRRELEPLGLLDAALDLGLDLNIDRDAFDAAYYAAGFKTMAAKMAYVEAFADERRAAVGAFGRAGTPDEIEQWSAKAIAVVTGMGLK